MAFLEEYTLLSELGKGGFATVYKVRHNELGYIRAVRVLNDTIQNKSDKAYKNFLRECKMLLVLGNGNHRGIVHIYKPDFLANKAVVEMDYVDGKDLLHYLADNNCFLPADEVVRMVTEMSSALAYCHEDIYKFRMDRDADGLEPDPMDGGRPLIDDATRQRLIDKYKVIHNDIHSRNIMRRENGDFVLLDFGLAIDGDEVGVSSSRRKAGALQYLSPEKWEDATVLTTQSDIYSFGVVMYEYLTGHVPFSIVNESSFSEQKKLYEKIMQESVPSIFEMRKASYEAKYPDKSYQKDYPDWLETAILKCLKKDPAKRFRNGKELYDFVQKHLGDDKDVVSKVEIDRILREKDVLINNLRIEKKNLQTDNAELTTQRDQLGEANSLLQTENEKLKKSLDGYNALKNAYDSLKEKKNVTIFLCVLFAVISLVFTILYFNSPSGVDSQDLLAKQEQIDDLNTRLEDMTSQLETKNTELQSKNHEITALNTQISSLQSDQPANIKELQTQIDDLKKQVKSKQSEIDDLKKKQKGTSSSDLAAKQKEIDNLNSLLTSKQSEINNLNNQLSAKQREISNLNSEITKLRNSSSGSNNSQEINRLKSQLTAKQNEIDRLNAEVAKKQNEIETLKKVMGTK